MSNLVNLPQLKEQYNNYINGKFSPPVNGKYFDVITPITGKVFAQAAHSSEEDLTLAVDAAYEACNQGTKHRSKQVNLLQHR